MKETMQRDWLHFLGLSRQENGKFRVSELPDHHAWFELTYQALRKSKNGKELTDNEANEVVLQLLFLWLSRLFLLRKIEKTLLAMHEDAPNFRFLTPQHIHTFEQLVDFTGEVIARKPQSRLGNEKLHFGHLPYLNSPIFEPHSLEKQYISLSDVKSNVDYLPPNELQPVKVVHYLLNLLTQDISENDILTMLMRFLPTHLPDISLENWQLFLRQTQLSLPKSLLFFPVSIPPTVWQAFLYQHLISLLNQGALTDEDGRQIVDYQFEIVKDTLQLVDTRDGEIFQYFAPKPIQKKAYQHAVTGKTIVVEEGRNKSQRQKVQEAIFVAKTNFLQNQFFLLENQSLLLHLHQLAFAFEAIDSAFYTQASGYTEWNLLPNVQRNFRQGELRSHSLPLAAKIPNGMTEYAQLFATLKKANEKNEQQKIWQNIQKMQQEWRLTWAKKEGRYAKLQKLQAEYYRKYADTGFFSLELSTEEEKEKVKLQADILGLEHEIGIKVDKNANKVEIRWDYPEIWDRKGHFKGFELVVLGYENEDIPSQLTFYQEILKQNGHLLAIFPNKVLYKTQYSPQRAFLLSEIDLQQIEKQTQHFFAKAQQQTPHSSTFQLSQKSQTIEKEYFNSPNFNEISLHLDNEILAILHKIKKNAQPLKEVAEIKRGATVKKSDLVNTAGVKMLLGQEIQRYQLHFENLHIATNHKEYVRLKDFFEAENVVFLSRNGSELIASVGSEPFAYSKNVYGLVFPPHIDKYFALALLNAPLLSQYYRLTFQTWEEYSPNEIQATLCERLPFVLPEVQTQKKLAQQSKALITAYQKGDTSAIEHLTQAISTEVLEIYGINEAEFERLLS